MRTSSILAILGGGLLASVAAAEFSYDVKVLQDGEERPQLAAGIELVPGLPHPQMPFLNATTAKTVMGKRADVIYSRNMCGAVQKAPTGDTLAKTFAYFTIPNLSLRKDIGTPQYASSSVGVDGVSCSSVFLKAGGSTQIASNGTQTTAIWFNWYPDASYTIAGFPASPGDWLSVSIEASTKLNVRLIINNLNTGSALDITLTGATGLCLSETTWTLEDAYDGVSDQLPFAAFSDIWFEETSTTTAKGTTLGVNGATMYSLVDSAFSVKCQAVQYDNSNFYMYSTN